MEKLLCFEEEVASPPPPSGRLLWYMENVMV